MNLRNVFLSPHFGASSEYSDLSAMKTRSSAQGICSAKSLAGNVADSSLSSSLSSIGGSRGRGSRGRGVQGWGVGEGRGLREEGQGIFHPPCHTLHNHMVLRP